jgi:DNA invertase Pin-like site-specific DNA recombinase
LNRLEDLGVSAWTGKNLSDESALGGFLKLIEQGKIPRQTVLIVENLDRLSRAKILDALHLFTSIIKNGVEIVTTMDGKWYSEKSITDNPTDLMVSIIYLTRGNNESETKSVRVRQSWINKHKNIQNGEFSKFHCPSWLKHNGREYALIPDNAETIRTIFNLYINGYGVYSLIQELNRRKVKPFTKSKDWKPVFIHRLLQNPAVIGTNENVDPPRPNYYPSVVSDEVFYKAIAQRKGNRNHAGRTGTREVNIFGGLCKCHRCGSSMVKYSCKGKGPEQKQYTFLVCSKAKVGKCKYEFTPFNKFSDSFLRILDMVNFTNLLFGNETPVKDRSESIKGKIEDKRKTISRIVDTIVRTGSEALEERLKTLELEVKQLEKDYETAKAETFAQTGVKQDYKELIQKLKANLHDNSFRLRLRNLMRRYMPDIVVTSNSYKIDFEPASRGAETIEVILNDTGFELRYWDEVETYNYGTI